MKLDLLYEFQPKIKPWDQPHPYGQREAEQATYDEAHRGDPVRRQARLPTPCGASSTTSATVGRPARANEAVLGGLALSTDATSARLRRRRSCRSGSSTRPAWPRRWRPSTSSVTAASSGAPGAPRRWSSWRFGVPTDDRSRAQWREAVEIVVKMWEQERSPGTANCCSCPSACRRPSRTRTRIRRAGWPRPARRRRVSAGRNGLGLLSFALLQPVEKMAEHHRRLPERPGRQRADRSHGSATTGSAPTPSCTATTTRRGRRLRPLGVGHVVVPAPRRVHPGVGAAQPVAGGAGRGVPAAQADHRGQRRRRSSTPTRT